MTSLQELEEYLRERIFKAQQLQMQDPLARKACYKEILDKLMDLLPDELDTIEINEELCSNVEIYSRYRK